MTMNQKTKLRLALCCLILFLLLIVLVRFADVAPIGPAETSIGLSGLNGAVRDAIGEHPFWYAVTELLGYLALLIAAGFALVGGVQWFRRKSFLKVDREILGLGVLYGVTLALYVFFDVVAVSYRPVLEAGQTFPEASFPSPHTMLACVIFGSATMLTKRYVKLAKAREILTGVGWFLLILTVGGRMLSGVHWLTDILGGILISAALLLLYACVVRVPGKAKAKK